MNYIMKGKVLTPEMETVINMMEPLSRDGQEKIVDILYDVISEVDSAEKWKTLLDKQPEPTKKMAADALKEHRQKKTRLLDL